MATSWSRIDLSSNCAHPPWRRTGVAVSPETARSNRFVGPLLPGSFQRHGERPHRNKVRRPGIKKPGFSRWLNSPRAGRRGLADDRGDSQSTPGSLHLKRNVLFRRPAHEVRQQIAMIRTVALRIAPVDVGRQIRDAGKGQVPAWSLALLFTPGRDGQLFGLAIGLPAASIVSNQSLPLKSFWSGLVIGNRSKACEGLSATFINPSLYLLFWPHFKHS